MRNMRGIPLPMLAAILCFSFLFTTFMAVSAQAENTYRDPEGRYTIRMPEGWAASSLGEGAEKFFKGDYSLTVQVWRGEDTPQSVLAQSRDMIAQVWRNFHQTGGADSTIAGLPAAFGLYSGVDRKGVLSGMKISVVKEGNKIFILTGTAPKSSFASAKKVFEKMEQSFQLAGQEGPSSRMDRDIQPSSGQSHLAHARPSRPLASIHWIEHQLADGSGRIKLPSDWKLTYSDFVGGASAEAPADRAISVGRGFDVTDPSTPYAAQFQAAGKAVVAPFSDPATAWTNLLPQLSQMSMRNGGPALTLDRIIFVQPAASSAPGMKAAWIYYAYTKSTARGSAHLRTLALYQCFPGMAGIGWKFLVTYEMTAPDAIFGNDLPMMIEIVRSWKLNDAQVYSNAGSYISSSNESFNAALHSIQKEGAKVYGKSSEGFQEGTMGEETVVDPDSREKKKVPLRSWDPWQQCYVRPDGKCYEPNR